MQVVFSLHSISDRLSVGWNQSRKMSPSKSFLEVLYPNLRMATFLEAAGFHIPAVLSIRSQNPQLPLGNSTI